MYIICYINICLLRPRFPTIKKPRRPPLVGRKPIGKQKKNAIILTN